MGIYREEMQILEHLAGTQKRVYLDSDTIGITVLGLKDPVVKQIKEVLDVLCQSLMVTRVTWGDYRKSRGHKVVIFVPSKIDYGVFVGKMVTICYIVDHIKKKTFVTISLVPDGTSNSPFLHDNLNLLQLCSIMPTK